MAAETEFEYELEIFRTEEETAQQYFFAYLSVRSLIATNNDVLKMVNTTPLFWKTAHHAMILSAFVALGRIFDQKSKHNPSVKRCQPDVMSRGTKSSEMNSC